MVAGESGVSLQAYGIRILAKGLQFLLPLARLKPLHAILCLQKRKNFAKQESELLVLHPFELVLADRLLMLGLGQRQLFFLVRHLTLELLVLSIGLSFQRTDCCRVSAGAGAESPS